MKRRTFLIGGETDTFAGGFELRVEAVTGNLAGDHELTVAIGPIDVSVSSTGESTAIEGSLRIMRAVAGSDMTIIATSLPQGALTVGETLDSVMSQRDLSDFTVSSTRSVAGAYSLGVADESLLLGTSIVEGDLVVSVLEPFAGSGAQPPATGSLEVHAADGSSLALRVEDGDVEIAVDADGDGMSDGTLHTSWDDLD